MKNKILLLTVSLSGIALASCTQNKDDPNTLIIEGAKLGYGVKWMEYIVSSFESDTGTKVKFTSYDGQSGIESLQGKIKAGGDGTDIFFSKITDYYKLGYQGFFADVSDVYTSKENGKSIEERTSSQFLEANKIDGKYIGFNWANGVFGYIRNNTIWNAMGLTDEDIPYTTDEMVALCKKVAERQFSYEGNQIYPLVYSYESEYYTTILPIWFNQYEGSENMAYFNEGLDPEDPEGSATHHASSFFARDGISEALNVVNEILVENPSFHHPKSKNYQFQSAQNDFLRNKTALFMVNGSWLDSETTISSYDVSFMNTPIISSLINSDRISTISDDATLSATVKYVRGVTSTKPANVSDEDIEVVKDAVENGSYMRSGIDHQLVICSNSKRMDLAKKFVSYMYSDKGLEIYHKSTNGGILGTVPNNGYSTDVETSPFKANVNKALEENNVCSYQVQVPSRLFCYGGINRVFANGLGDFGSNCVKAMVSFNKTPIEVYNINQNYLDRNWSSILNQAGLN